jgi:TatD DNase family protein
MHVILIDTHCHIDVDPMRLDVAGVLARARAAGVSAVVLPGVNVETSVGAVEISRAHAGVVAAAGVHPDAVDVEKTADIEALDRLVLGGGVAAIGEVGLDRSGTGRDLAAQGRVRRARYDPGVVRPARTRGGPARLERVG